MSLLVLQAKFPEFKLESVILSSMPPQYATSIVINGRVLHKVVNQTSLDYNFKEIENYLLEYAVQTLIKQSKEQ